MPYFMELEITKTQVREAVLDDRKADRAVESALAQKLEAVRKVGDCLNRFAADQGPELAKAIGKDAGLTETVIRRYMSFAKRNPDKVTTTNYREAIRAADQMVQAAQPVLHGRNGHEPRPGERGYPDPDPLYDHMAWCEEIKALVNKVVRHTAPYLENKDIDTWSIEECDFFMTATYHAAALYGAARQQRLDRSSNAQISAR